MWSLWLIEARQWPRLRPKKTRPTRTKDSTEKESENGRCSSKGSEDWKKKPVGDSSLPVPRGSLSFNCRFWYPFRFVPGHFHRAVSAPSETAFQLSTGGRRRTGKKKGFPFLQCRTHCDKRRETRSKELSYKWATTTYFIGRMEAYLWVATGNCNSQLKLCDNWSSMPVWVSIEYRLLCEMN
jgi:hypothetical protein